MSAALLSSCLIVITILTNATALDKKADSGSIVGTWTLVSEVIGGTKVPQENIRDCFIVFKNNGQVEIKVRDISVTGTFKLDTTKKPKQIVMKGDQVFVGIYELQGTSLKICGGSGEKVPAEFISRKGTKRVLFILKRQK